MSESDAIVVGSAHESRWLADPENVERTIKSDARDLSAVTPSKFVVGVLTTLKTEYLLYSKKRIISGPSVEIYVKDGYAAPTDTDIPIFVKGRRYLVFLKRLQKEQSFDRVKLYIPSDLSAKATQFEPKTAFVVSSARLGKIQLDGTNEHIVDEVRQAISARRLKK